MTMFFSVGSNTYLNAAAITSVTLAELDGVRRIMYIVDKSPIWIDLGTEEADRLCAIVFPGMTREEIEALHFGGDDSAPGPARRPTGGGPRGVVRRRRVCAV